MRKEKAIDIIAEYLVDKERFSMVGEESLKEKILRNSFFYKAEESVIEKLEKIYEYRISPHAKEIQEYYITSHVYDILKEKKANYAFITGDLIITPIKLYGKKERIEIIKLFPEMPKELFIACSTVDECFTFLYNLAKVYEDENINMAKLESVFEKKIGFRSKQESALDLILELPKKPKIDASVYATFCKEFYLISEESIRDYFVEKYWDIEDFKSLLEELVSVGKDEKNHYRLRVGFSLAMQYIKEKGLENLKELTYFSKLLDVPLENLCEKKIQLAIAYYEDSLERFIDFFEKLESSEKEIVISNLISEGKKNEDVDKWLEKNYPDLIRKVTEKIVYENKEE